MTTHTPRTPRPRRSRLVAPNARPRVANRVHIRTMEGSVDYLTSPQIPAVQIPTTPTLSVAQTPTTSATSAGWYVLKAMAPTPRPLSKQPIQGRASSLAKINEFRAAHNFDGDILLIGPFESRGSGRKANLEHPYTNGDGIMVDTIHVYAAA